MKQCILAKIKILNYYATLRLVNDRNGISPEPDRNRNMDFLPNRNRTGTETHYRNISINIFSDLRICKEFLINILKTTADFL